MSVRPNKSLLFQLKGAKLVVVYLCFFFFNFSALLAQSSWPQYDLIRTHSGKEYKVIYKFDNEELIVYYDWIDGKKGKQKMEIDKFLVKELIIGYSKEEEIPIPDFEKPKPQNWSDYPNVFHKTKSLKMDDPNPELDEKKMINHLLRSRRMNAIKGNVVAIATGSMGISFERAISRFSSFELGAQLHGYGIQYVNQSKGGFTAEIRYKQGFTLMSKRKYYVPRQILNKTYLALNLAFTSVQEKKERLGVNFNRLEFRNREYLSIGFDLGKQIVAHNNLIFDFYGGVAYFNGLNETIINANGIINNVGNRTFIDGDFWGGVFIGYKLGFRMGYTF